MSRPPQPSDAPLPIPDAGDVAGFVELYRREYGVELDDVQATEILGGLMRWAWLAREQADGERAEADGRDADDRDSGITPRDAAAEMS